MKLRFLGAAGTVTGSRYLVETPGTRLLVDCGLFQGVKNIRRRNWLPFPVAPDSLRAVVLTHAHLDHSGHLPRLWREGFRGTVWCTPATRELAEILLLDSAHLQEEDARHANQHGYSRHDPAEPLYTTEDAQAVLKLFRTVPYGESFHVGDFLLRFSRAGHILGSASLRIEQGQRSVTFSGDVGRPEDLVMLPPETLADTDYLVLESTYGDRLHQPATARSRLAELVRDTVSHGGTLLIPAFAVGRAQVMTHLLTELMQGGDIPTLPIYLDSPMAIDVAGVFSHHREDHRLSREQCLAMSTHVTFVRTGEESRELTSNHYPKIIIAGAGMLNGGRILHHLRAFGGDDRNTLVITGYQAEGTRGQALLNGAGHLRIYGQDVIVRCRVEQLEDLSAHADYQELLDWLAPLKTPRHVFVTHGEAVAADSLRQKLAHQRQWPASVPEQGDEVTLD